MSIDSHCHAGKGDAMTAPWKTVAPLLVNSVALLAYEACTEENNLSQIN
jgi:hypothetical protein